MANTKRKARHPKPKKEKTDGEIILTPQQEEFLSFYTDPQSETFGNAYQSALRAKYSKDYAENIMHHYPNWLAENVGDSEMLDKAVRNLRETLDIDIIDPVIGPFGPIINKKTKKPYTRRNVKILAIKHDASKFVAERLGKRKYSSRSELTGPEGKPLVILEEGDDPKES